MRARNGIWETTIERRPVPQKRSQCNPIALALAAGQGTNLHKQLNTRFVFISMQKFSRSTRSRIYMYALGCGNARACIISIFTAHHVTHAKRNLDRLCSARTNIGRVLKCWTCAKARALQVQKGELFRHKSSLDFENRTRALISYRRKNFNIAILIRV